MSKDKIKVICDEADMVIKGYAFSKQDGFIHVFNTNDGVSAMIIKEDGTLIETNMSEIEQTLVRNIWARDSKYMEVL